MHKLLICLLLITTFAYSQTKTITGVVSDTLNNPLEQANVMAKPLQDGAQLKFAIADNKGRYKLELENGIKYEIAVSYIGFNDQVFTFDPASDVKSYNFKLQPTGIDLKEIVITHDFKPIVVKKDTLLYDVASFASGNERKMKEVLEKLPGVEVDKDGNVTVQGKKVTQLLVEGKLFFGGGSKLAVENIPADALDKIEVIDHFNQVGFMKQVSDSEDLAMNVKLKEDKKNFIFGDVEASAGNDKYYQGHAGLFYYSPKTNISFIGDMNNIGQSTFSYADLSRFGGGASSFLAGRPSLVNLDGFAGNNTDVRQNKSQFGALNFSHQVNDKLAVSGFAMFSKMFTATRSESEILYLQNEGNATEDRLYNSSNNALMALGNIKLDYDASKKEKWYYNAQYQFSNNNFGSTLNSVINGNTSMFETLSKADNSAVKQYIEWHKAYNANHTTTFVVNQSYEKNTPQNTWITNQEFLPGLIPLQDDTTYNVNQIKSTTNNTIDALFKHYWVLNNYNHIYSVIGNNNINTHFVTAEKQLLTNGTVNNFADNANFGNNLHYNLNDAYAGIEYKFKIGKLLNRPGIYLHWYRLDTQQPDNNYRISKTLFQPQWNTEYEFNKSESLRFNYRLANNFANGAQMADRYTLQSYNSVFKGNALLRNERYHSAFLYYSKINMYRGITINGSASFNKKVRTIRNQINVEQTEENGVLLINQFTTPAITDNPETRWNTQGTVQKKIWNFNLKLNAGLSWFNYIQTLNGQTTTNTQNSQNVGVSLRTANVKWPSVMVGYNKSFSQFSGLVRSDYKNDTFNTSLDYTLFKEWVIKADYMYFNNNNTQNQSNYYQVGNASLSYQKKDSPWGFEARVNNFLNNRQKTTSSFSDYTIATQTIYILPRITLFTVRYKL